MNTNKKKKSFRILFVLGVLIFFVIIFTTKKEKETTETNKKQEEMVQNKTVESERLSVTDRLFGEGKKMKLSENPISRVSFNEQIVYFKGEKTGSFCYGLLKDNILSEITLKDIEEFCSMILSKSEFKAICLFPFLNDDVQKGFVFLKVGDFAIHGHFGVFDRQTGAISKSDWECYYDILNKKIEKLEDVN